MSVLKKIWKKLFYAPKYTELTDDNISHMLLLSFIGIAVCAVCLVGLTLAWFTAGVETAPQRLTAASFSVTVEVSGETPEAAGGFRVDSNAETGVTVVTFSRSGQYRIDLHPQGGGSGYCKIAAQDTVYYTQSLRDEKASLTITVADQGVCTVTACWGTYAGNATLSLKDTIALAPEIAVVEPPVVDQPDPDESVETTPVTPTPAETTPSATEPAPAEAGDEQKPAEAEQTEPAPNVEPTEAEPTDAPQEAPAGEAPQEAPAEED